MANNDILNADTRQGLVSWGIKGFLYKVYVALVLIISAGRWDWLEGWLYAAIFLLFDLATAIVVIPRSPGLLLERSRRNPGVKAWDKILMPLSSGLLPLFTWSRSDSWRLCPDRMGHGG
jgi:hypothetical protein